MSIAAGLAILFAGLSLFLALALTGALVQRRGMVRQIERLRSADGLPAFMADKLVLLVSQGCRACAAALEEVDQSGFGNEVVVLSSSLLESRPEAIVDIELWNQLYPGFTPCMVAVGPDRRPGVARPVNSQAAIRDALRGLASR